MAQPITRHANCIRLVTRLNRFFLSPQAKRSSRSRPAHLHRKHSRERPLCGPEAAVT